MPAGVSLQRGLVTTSIVAATAGLLLAVFGLPVPAIVLANLIAIGAGMGAWAGAKTDQTDSVLIAEVSHELRTPLTGILGTLELLTEPTMPLETSEVDELLIAAHGEANHLLHVVGNLHARSRLDREVLRPEAIPTNLRAIVEKAISRSLRVARRCYLSPGDQAVAVGDPQLIMQIVTNLIQNISRYAPDGEVRISFAASGERLAVSFSDSGPGIPAYKADSLFEAGSSTQGLGLGLALSRQLARVMGGDLTLDNPGSAGATFTLWLPSSSATVAAVSPVEAFPEERIHAHSPRARLLVDLAEALSEQSLDHVVGGIRKIYSELLGATGAVLFVSRKDGTFYSASAYGPSEDLPNGKCRELDDILAGHGSNGVTDIASVSWLKESAMGGTAAMLLPVHDGGKVVAVLGVGWKSVEAMPSGAAVSVAEALADLTASAIARTALFRDVVFERRLRASVIDELPLAVSIFVGDPPEVVDWNRKERELLGIDGNGQRPNNLGLSQREFDVRFANGTPLTIDNAPVTTAIRTGKATGPFILSIRRADGVVLHTRTYCAPFFDDAGAVAGAVVTSEPLDLAAPPPNPDLTDAE